MKESESIKNKMETLKYNSTRLHVVSYIPSLVAVFACRDQSKSTLCFIWIPFRGIEMRNNQLIYQNSQRWDGNPKR